MVEISILQLLLAWGVTAVVSCGGGFYMGVKFMFDAYEIKEKKRKIR